MSKLVGILACESDRGLALTGAAMLDDALGVILKAHMLDRAKIVSSVIGLDRPLGTFSSRIKITYLLGLLDDSEFRDLELIRKIRNDCAHNREDVNFGGAPHKDRIGELQTPKQAEELFSTFFAESFTDEGRSPRNQLLIAISVLGVWLIIRADMVNRTTVPNFSDVKRRLFEAAKRQSGAG